MNLNLWLRMVITHLTTFHFNPPLLVINKGICDIKGLELLVQAFDYYHMNILIGI